MVRIEEQDRGYHSIDKMEYKSGDFFFFLKKKGYVSTNLDYTIQPHFTWGLFTVS